MIYAEAEMSTFPLLPAGSMYGWLGRALTIVSLPSPTSIRSPETYIPPKWRLYYGEGIQQWPPTICRKQSWLYSNHRILPRHNWPTVIHWLIVNGVTRAGSRIRSHHNRPTINIWRAVRGGVGAYFTHPDHPSGLLCWNFHFVKDRKFEIEARNCIWVKSFSPPLGFSASQDRDMSGGGGGWRMKIKRERNGNLDVIDMKKYQTVRVSL